MLIPLSLEVDEIYISRNNKRVRNDEEEGNDYSIKRMTGSTYQRQLEDAVLLKYFNSRFFTEEEAQENKIA